MEREEIIKEMDPKLMDPRFNNLIPRDDGEEVIDEKDLGNNQIPGAYKPAGATLNSIFAELSKGETARVGDFVIQRRYRHEEGGAGGECYEILNSETGESRGGIELNDLAKVKTVEDLEALMRE